MGKRERSEYQRERYSKKKDRKAELKKEKMEKYYMGKEDVKALTATLAPPSAPTSPSERLCSTIEDASALIVEQRCSVGEVLLSSPSFLSYYDNEGLSDVDFRELLLSVTEEGRCYYETSCKSQIRLYYT